MQSPMVCRRVTTVIHESNELDMVEILSRGTGYRRIIRPPKMSQRHAIPRGKTWTAVRPTMFAPGSFAGSVGQIGGDEDSCEITRYANC